MRSTSIQFSPVIVELTATKVVSNFGQKIETIIDKERIDMGYEEDRSGSCEITNEITLAGVFGQYTSLKTGIRVHFPCDPSRFETEAERYHGRIVTAIQNFQNRVIEATGRPTVWQQGPSPAPPGGAIPPATAKRTRRPRRS
jgi:hypothetical protein